MGVRRISVYGITQSDRGVWCMCDTLHDIDISDIVIRFNDVYQIYIARWWFQPI